MAAPRRSLATDLDSVPAAFRAVVERHGDHPAVESDGVAMTYAELDRLSNRVAQHLLASGGDEPIATLASIDSSSLVLAYGALKAGRIWSPLDPRDPPERTQAIVEQLGAELVRPGELERLLSDRADDPALELDADTPAVVYFTSGSSGQPKGAVKCHRELIRLREVCEAEPGDRFALVVPLAFTASYLPVFGGLLGGATVCCFDPALQGLGALGGWLDDARVTMLFAAPSVLRAVGAALEAQGRRADSVRLAIVAGELCRGADLAAPRRVMPNAAVVNLYGSSEAGAIATTRIDPGEPIGDGPIPLRRVCPWLSVEIVDGAGRVVPAGEVGDIRVRGQEVSLGYWNDPEQTSRRFLAEPDGTRTVVTGDRGRFSSDGTLEHLGRADLRVKVHGQMVDPEEVEQALAALPSVREAVVSPVPAQAGDTTLVAHVLPEEESRPSARDLRLGLAQRLPSYMIPSAFLAVDAIPRNERGKVDREALRQAALGAAPAETAYVPPRSRRERELAELVAEVLGLERVGVHDDVLDLGADSFAAVELLAAIGERLGVELAPGDLLEASTIEALALRIEDEQSSAGHVLFPLSPGGSGTPFFLVSSFDGAMLPLRPLARRLDRPTYSFVPRGVDTRAWPDRTIERAAARYVGAVRAIQAAGPYLIGGYSSGGLVAYEMSRQLAALGEKVALVALIDPAAPERVDPVVIRRIARGLEPAPVGTTTWLERTRRVPDRFLQWCAGLTAGIVRWEPRRQSAAFFCLSLGTQGRYRPGPYDGATLFLLTERWERLLSRPLGLMGGKQRSVRIPGDHVSLLREPHVATVASLLKEALLAADSGKTARQPGQIAT
jgi:acyl-coenzyme A synthetase/AMP-(fatty) acid ligase/thioesterase domain-containing protein/acyl carrier protein